MIRTTLAAIALCFAAGSASAATLIATKTPISQDSSLDFLIMFSDLNNNHLLDFPEIVSFSGISLFGNMVAVLAVPDIPGISVLGSAPGATLSLEPGFWHFEEEGMIDNVYDAAATPIAWSYQLRLASVPLPATLPLMLAGVGGLALARRRSRL